MIFDHIEQLKKQYTDKYVVVDLSRPELQRFKGLTGAVKTVNMSGRALVEFDGYNNIGWFDIDPAFLTVVPPPAPKPAESKKDKAAAPKAESPKAPAAGAKPVGEKAAAAKLAAAAPKSTAEILAAARKPAPAATAGAEAKPAAAPGKVPPGGKGMSMADILAAARGKGGAAAAASSASGSEGTKASVPAPAKPAAPAAASAPAGKVPAGGKGMSMEQILAMARGKSAGAAPAAAPSAPVAEEPAAVAEEPAAEESTPEPESAAPTAGDSKSMKDRIKTVAEQIAYCRKVDKK